MNYVISDIHGCYDELIELVKLIDLRDEDTLYIIGDTVDRGPKPIEVLSWMMMQPNVIPIMGNHEYMMMRVLLPGLKEVDSNEAIDKTITLDYLTDVNLWFLSDNGGKITSDSFRKLPKCDREDLLDYVKDFSFYEEVTVSGQRFVMVHAMLIPTGSMIQIVMQVMVTKMLITKLYYAEMNHVSMPLLTLS